jgi:O-glycosyl hydrolase
MNNRITLIGVIFSLWAGWGPAEITVQIDPEVRFQVWDGFGEGTMDQFTPYYYKQYPATSRTDYLDKLYTLDDSGLGLTICRVLMPVGDAPGHSHMGRFYGENGQCPPSFEPDGGFDWDNPKHQEILWKIRGAAERGARMWANWYSVPYWMTVSGCTAGHTDGSMNNLKTDMEGRFAEHVCRVLAHFRDAWNVNFDFLNPINEPEANWWVYGGGQPGCRVTDDQAIRIFEQLNAKLPIYNLSPKLVAYDSAYTNTAAYLNTLLNSPIGGDLDVLSCHQYVTSDAAMRQWAYLAARHDKKLWQTEWGDWDNAQYPGKTPGGDPLEQMKNYAAKIHEALNTLNVSGWVIWEPEFLFDSQTKSFVPRKSYWAVAQYSRHVRPGMQRIHSTSSHADVHSTVWLEAERRPAGRDFVIVTYNRSTESSPVAYDLSVFISADIVEVRQTSASQDYQKLSTAATDVRTFRLVLGGESITTIVGRIRGCAVLSADLKADCIVGFRDLAILAER